MTNVYLYGSLGRKFGYRWSLDISSPGEAVRAIMANRPDFQRYLIEHSLPGYQIFVGPDPIPGPEGFGYPVGRQAIKIVPVVAGRGKGVMSIIIGVVLVAAVIAAFVFTGPGGGLLTAKGALTIWGSLAVAAGFIGAGLIVGGISSLLTTTPEATAGNENPANKPSAIFNGPVNTVSQGHPVPIGYGRLRVGSAVISFGIQTVSVPV